MLCLTLQPAGKSCQECGEELARYYCDKCKFWDDDPKKSIYHCDDCGICRQGKGLGEDFFHCKKCNICLHISMKDHKCIERNLESDCPICGEYMFTSTATVIFMVRRVYYLFIFKKTLTFFVSCHSHVVIVSTNIVIPIISKRLINVPLVSSH